MQFPRFILSLGCCYWIFLKREASGRPFIGTKVSSIASLRSSTFQEHHDPQRCVEKYACSSILHLARGGGEEDAMTEPTEEETTKDIPCLATGTFEEAVRAARRSGRFLVALETNEPKFINILLSDPVIKLAERKSKKVSPYGSYLLWVGSKPSRNAKDTMRVLASKRQVLGTSAPAQTTERLVQYLKDIRQRNLKLLKALAKRRQEQQWAEERTQQYRQSQVSDDQKRKEEQEALERERALAEEERRRQEEILERREALKQSIPDEPEAGIVVALRFPDGTTSQRTFVETEPIGTLFNWVDAFFEHEREKVKLQTMNGKQTLAFDEDDETTTLGESIEGRKSIAYRVLLQ